MSKFRVDDKVVCIVSDGFNHNYIVEGIPYTVVDKESPELCNKGEVTLLTVNLNDIYFKLYKEKEMKEFDLHKNPWYIRVENEEQFNVVNEWLKENFGNSLMVDYWDGFVGITNTNEDNNLCDKPMWLDEGHIAGDVFRHEIKVNFKTIISSVEYHLIETEQQKRIRELKATIDNASKQLEELMKETK